MTPLLTSLVAFAIIFAGTFVGMLIRSRLPEGHLSGDTRDVVRLGTGLIGSLAALVLGLLISSANSTYESQSDEVKQMTATFVLLDRTLALYGSETNSVRVSLRKNVVGPLANRIWRENGSTSHKVEPFVEEAASGSVYEDIVRLSPQNDAQSVHKARAIEIANDVAKTRLLLFAKADRSMPTPFLVVLVFWLTIIFASYSLFAEINATSITALFVFALSASGSLFLILELSQPFTGLMMIPSEPLRNALAPLGT